MGSSLFYDGVPGAFAVEDRERARPESSVIAANPNNSIAQVDGSGTGVRISVVKLSSVVTNGPEFGLIRIYLIGSSSLSKPKKEGELALLFTDTG